jgi:hypothetical protein
MLAGSSTTSTCAYVEASKRFYAGALAPLSLGIMGEGEGWFSADELLVTTSGSHIRATRRLPSAGSRDR